jgi:hypothetical protein
MAKEIIMPCQSLVPPAGGKKPRKEKFCNEPSAIYVMTREPESLGRIKVNLCPTHAQQCRDAGYTLAPNQS